MPPALQSLAHFYRPGVSTWRTIPAYTDGAALFVAFLARQGMPTAARSIRREHAAAFTAAERERTAPSPAATRDRSLQQLFGWLDEEGTGRC